MHMPDAIAKLANELHRVDELVDEMAGVKVEAEGGVVIDGFQGAAAVMMS